MEDSNPESRISQASPEVGLVGLVPIQTERLLLRAFVDSDAPAVELLLNDKEIASNTRTIDYPYPKGAGIEWISKITKWRETGDGYAFAICRPQQDGEGEFLIGAVGLEINKEDHNAELGYWLGREFWNQGYCTEAAKSVIEFGFETVGLRRITSNHMVRNPASGRVMDKIGMTREGLLRKHVRKWGVFEDVVVYGMLSGDPRG